MNISERELRELVREAVARQSSGQNRSYSAMERPLTTAASGTHTSHALLALVSGGDADGRCLIEPAVVCTHCGYCQSLGH